MITELTIAFAISTLVMFIMWLYYLKSNNPGVVDVGWGLGIMACGQWYLYGENFYQIKIICANLLLIFWGMRLSGFLWYTRIRPKHVDKRYLDIAKSWQVKQSLGFLANFMLQAFLLYFIALPFFFISKNPALSSIDLVAIVIVLIGVSGEALADLQLYKFKQIHPGKLCNVGLWKYSRHPNYFFEILVWLGFGMLALYTPFGVLAFISPILLIYIMIFITGPITERGSLQAKGEEYLKYQRSTSMIVPWPKRK